MSLPAGVLPTAAGRVEALRALAAAHPRHVVLFGLVAGLLAAGGPRWVVGAAAAGAAALAVGRLRIAAAIAVLAGAVGGEARLAALDAGVLPALHGRYVTARAELAEPVRDRLRPATARARLLTGPAAGEQVVLKLRTSAPRAWPQTGAIVAVEGRVRPLGPYDAHQRRRGARAALDTFVLRATRARRGGLAGALDAVRGRAERGLERSLPPPEAALLRGMVLGQDELIEADVREDFRRSGLAHLLSI